MEKSAILSLLLSPSLPLSFPLLAWSFPISLSISLSPSLGHHFYTLPPSPPLPPPHEGPGRGSLWLGLWAWPRAGLTQGDWLGLLGTFWDPLWKAQTPQDLIAHMSSSWAGWRPVWSSYHPLGSHHGLSLLLGFSRFCVGDKFFLKNNMILCQMDYEEGQLNGTFDSHVQ